MLPNRSPRLLKKRRNRIIIRTSLLVVGVLIILSLPIILLNLSFWKIRTVTVSGNSAVLADSIQAIATADLSGRVEHVFPRANLLFFPRSVISHDVVAAFPRILSARVSIENLHTINIAVTERMPNALWCDGVDCYLMDSNGIVFDHAPDIEQASYLVYRGELGTASTTGPLGSEYSDPEEFASLQAFAAGVKASNLDPVSITALGESEYEMALSGGEVIFFTTRMPVSETLSNLSSVLADPSLSLRADGGLSVSSLDLRYGDKVFYKKKGE